MKVLYTAQATTTGGREGHVVSSDGLLDMDLAIPRELGGPDKNATNPEQLFAAGYSACFDSAVRSVARQRKIALKESSVTARVGIGKTEAGGYGLEVDLLVSLPGVPTDTAEDLIHGAHQVCPYSNATRGNIDVRVSLLESEPA